MKKYKLFIYVIFIFAICICQFMNCEIIQKKDLTLQKKYNYNIKIITKLPLIETIKLLNILNNIILKENYDLQSKEIIISKNGETLGLSIPKKITKFINNNKINNYWIIYVNPNIDSNNIVLGNDLFLMVNCDNLSITCISMGE